MARGFTKGLIVGGLLGAAASMMFEPEEINYKTGKRIVKAGRQIMNGKAGMVRGVVRMFRD